MKKLTRFLMGLLFVALLGMPVVAAESYFPNGFPHGANVRGINVLNTYGGNVFWVDSGSGSDQYSGTFSWPFATIDYAIGRCTASNGDIILVKPGHAETLTAAAGIDADVAGITIVGLGNGTNRPTITFGTSTATDLDIDAANIAISNIRFVTGIDALVSMIDVNSADASFIGCDFISSSALEALEFMNVATAAARLEVQGSTFLSTTAGANQAINIAGTGDQIVIVRNTIMGDFANAGIYSPEVFTNANISDNTIYNTQTGDHAIELTAAATGILAYNRCAGDTIAAIIDPGSMYPLENYCATGNANSGSVRPTP